MVGGEVAGGMKNDGDRWRVESPLLSPVRVENDVGSR